MSNLNESVSPAEVKVGSHVKFRVVSMKDFTVYTGTVIGVGTYTYARTFDTDIASAHLTMSQGASQRGLGSLLDIKSQKFLIVECMDKVIRPFAFEWIMDVNEIHNKMNIVSEGVTYNIRLYDVSSEEVTSAIQLLRDKGYTCKLTVIN